MHRVGLLNAFFFFFLALLCLIGDCVKISIDLTTKLMFKDILRNIITATLLLGHICASEVTNYPPISSFFSQCPHVRANQ